MTRALIAGIAAAAMLALPVVAQVRSGGHRSHRNAAATQADTDALNAAMDDLANAAEAAANAAEAAANAAVAAAEAAGDAGADNMATDVDDLANGDVGMDDNMAMDANMSLDADMTMDTNMTMDANMTMDMSPAPPRHRARRHGARRGH